MSVPKMLFAFTIVLFGVIGVASFFKKDRQKIIPVEITEESVEVELAPIVALVEEKPAPIPVVKEEKKETSSTASPILEYEIPNVDRITEFFSKREPRFPIVETITYKSRVPWLKGRPAWIADYSTHYKTSRHFIARSLNGKAIYDKQDIAEGDRFNVFKEDKDIEFYLVVDVLTNNMLFYYIDRDKNERVLVKTYPVGLGREDQLAESGSLTPLGKYTLGERTGVYRPKNMGYHQGEKVELVRIFGTRWIPFGEEVSGCTDSPKGYGIHGLPLLPNEKGELVENMETLGKYQSDGCVRMATKDIEELFSIIISRPTIIELVKGLPNATPPGEEKRG